jgi:HK97 family phage major capsid protein
MPTSIEQEYARVQRELKEVSANLQEAGDAFKETRREVRELAARLQVAEQVLAERDTHRSSIIGGGPGLGELALQGIESNSAFAHLREGNVGTCRLNVANGIRAVLTNEGMGTSNDSSVPSQAEQRGFVGPALRPLRLLDVLPQRPTQRDSVEYVQIQAEGDASEQVLEGDEKPSVEFAGTKETANIVTIAAWTAASKQVLGDHPALQSQIDRVLRHKLLSRLEHQIVNGPGGQGKIDGLLNQGTQFSPTIGSTLADVIGESLVRQADAGYVPNVVVLNPLDWFGLQTTRDGEERYLFGSPTMPVDPSLWNVRVVTTPSLEAGQFMTIDTTYLSVIVREDISIMLSNSHDDFFVRNLIAILGELRAGLEILDTGAIHIGDVPSS